MEEIAETLKTSADEPELTSTSKPTLSQNKNL